MSGKGKTTNSEEGMRGEREGRPQRLVCWRVLHGQLGCNAFLHHVNPSLFASKCCATPACCQQRCVETLTHAFLECPEVRPAVEWLQQTWEQLAGERYAVPLTPAFLLADDPEGWVGADDGGVVCSATRLGSTRSPRHPPHLPSPHSFPPALPPSTTHIP